MRFGGRGRPTTGAKALQTATIFGVIAAAAACGDGRTGGAKSAEPPRVEAVLAALDARAEACRKKGDAEPPAKCIAASPPVATEPTLCAEYQESATTEHKEDGTDR